MTIFHVALFCGLFFSKNLISGPWTALLSTDQSNLALAQPQIPTTSQSQAVETIPPQAPAVISEVPSQSPQNVAMVSAPVLTSAQVSSAVPVVSQQNGTLFTQEEIEKIKQEAIAQYLKKEMDRLSTSQLSIQTQSIQPAIVPNPVVTSQEQVSQIATSQAAIIPGTIPL
jgi:hypothetical protein